MFLSEEAVSLVAWKRDHNREAVGSNRCRGYSFVKIILIACHHAKGWPYLLGNTGTPWL